MVMEMTNLDVSAPISSSMAAGVSAAMAQQAPEEDADELSPSRGPPSEASSQEWDRLTDPGSQSQTSAP